MCTHTKKTSKVTSGRLVTLCTHDNFIVLPHSETKPSGPRLDILKSHDPDNEPTSPWHISNNGEHLARKRESINFYISGLTRLRFEPVGSNLTIFQTEALHSTQSAIPFDVYICSTDSATAPGRIHTCICIYTKTHIYIGYPNNMYCL